MRKQWICSRCGFPCSSTWRSLKNSIPVMCDTCKLKEANDEIVMNSNLMNQLSADETGARIKLLGSSSLTQIRPSSSENVAVAVGEIGMIFGNLTFEPTLAIPLTIRGKSQELSVVKSEVVTADDHQIYSGKSSTLGDNHSAIQIKQEYESDNETIWDTKNVEKKKRTKLPQYTLSPLARFINQLRHAPPCRRRRARRAVVVGPKYDDVLIYERCTLSIAENEIGLGAELLVSHSPPAVYGARKSTALVMKEESYS